MDIREKGKLGLTGLLIGAAAVILTVLGNPGNMGFCIACFLRDTAGAMHLHTAPIVEYVRPEIIGIIMGSFAISVATGDFRPRGGSSPVLRFIIGFIVMVGALVFLGCPLRMVLRLAGGDLNALIGLLGFIAGIGVGCIFLSSGFTLGKAEKQSAVEGAALPGATILLFVLFLAVPSLFLFSESGPGSMHAPVAAALLAGLLAGVAAERTRLCMAGGIRDIFLIRDFTLISGFAAIFLAILLLFTFANFASNAPRWNAIYKAGKVDYSKRVRQNPLNHTIFLSRLSPPCHSGKPSDAHPPVSLP